MTVAIPKNMRGGSPLNIENDSVKDVSWEIEQKCYVIQNVPLRVYDEYMNERVYESDVAMKLFLLKDLMESGEIPANIDFQQVMNLQLQ